jgi:hypothetical protein
MTSNIEREVLAATLETAFAKLRMKYKQKLSRTSAEGRYEESVNLEGK